METHSRNTRPLSEMELVRMKIREEIAEIDINLSKLNATEIEKRIKALSALLKLTQSIDIQNDLEIAKQTAIGLAKTQDAHTPYDQIRPPTDEEMCSIRDRLNRIYDRLRRSDDPQIRSGSVKPDGTDSP